MYNLTPVEGYRPPIREEIYVLDIIPLSSGPVTISSDQRISAFNPASLSQGPVKSWQTDHGNITCAKGFDLGGAVVCTAGEDGSVSMWDLRLDEQQAQVARLAGGLEQAVVGGGLILYEHLQADAQYRQYCPNSIIGLLKCGILGCGWHRAPAQSSIHPIMVSETLHMARRTGTHPRVGTSAQHRHRGTSIRKSIAMT